MVRAMRRLMSVVMPLAGLVTLDWFSDLVRGEPLFFWIEAREPWLSVLEITAVALLMIAIGSWVYAHRNRYLGVRTLAQGTATPHRCLIMAVSLPSVTIESRISGVDAAQWALEKVMSLEAEGQESVDIDAAIAALAQGVNGGQAHNWQQMLRALKPHLRPDQRAGIGLERIVLFGSEESEDYIVLAAQLLRIVLPGDDPARVTVHTKPVDFRRIESLISEYRIILDRLRDEEMPEDQIVIDATGGMKTTSIAAAMMTLKSKVTFQYVDTAPPYEVEYFDVETEFEKV